jgi:hypothetical protein
MVHTADLQMQGTQEHNLIGPKLARNAMNSSVKVTTLLC